MKLSKSKKVLKISGIISIIISVLIILLGVLTLIGGGFVILGLSANTADLSADVLKNGSLGASIMIFLGLAILVLGILFLLTGIFAIRATNDTKKIMPVKIFSLINMIIYIILTIFIFIGSTTSPSIADICVFAFLIIINLLVFISATIVKRNS